MSTTERFTVFDVDRTLLIGPTTVWALAQLSSEGKLDAQAAQAFTDLASLRATGEAAASLTYIRETGTLLANHLAGTLQGGDIEEVADRATEHWKAQIFPEMQPELEIARSMGSTALISHGPDIFIRMLAQKLDLSIGAGRTHQDFAEHHRPNKITMIEQACADLGVDLEQVELAAYGDAKDDRPMLLRATHPVLVNAMNPELQAEALQEGWRVMSCSTINVHGEFGNLSPAWLGDS